MPVDRQAGCLCYVMNCVVGDRRYRVSARPSKRAQRVACAPQEQIRLRIEDACTAHGARNITGADANPPGQPFERTAEYLCDSNCGLFVLLYEIPVRVHLK